MKASELRIGNKFYLPNGEVGTISYHEIRLLVVSQEKPNYKPIPLTEEWLLKFGFEKDIDDLYLELKHLLFVNYNDDEFVHIKNMALDTITSIKYVHQLQNLYWCLCGEELKLKEHERKTDTSR